ncbi:MAG: aldose epimerase family protein [Rikenellaceae bacterium]
MKNIEIYTLKSGEIEMVVTNLGGRVMKLFTPDAQGNMRDIVLGYNTIEEYLDNRGERFLGAVCGRFANRIGNGCFTIDGEHYNLPKNNNGQTLHGGLKGLDMVVWSVIEATDSSILFRYISPDGEEGFPGELSIDMLYKLTEDNEFVIEYSAVTDKKSPVSITHHSFFNLRGEGNGSINDHIMQINASHYLPIDEFYIPTGEIAPVENTPLDFLSPTPIGERLECGDHQLAMGTGYDHCFVIDGEGFRLAATVIDKYSGRKMEVYSDQPGMQFYGGNFFDGSTISKDGAGSYIHRGTFALETQHFPDAPNKPSFPDSMLLPGEVYTHKCIYKFLVC